LIRNIFRLRASLWRIALPPVFTAILFISTIFILILPFIEQSILARKREMISELVSITWSDLQSFEHLERSGQLTRQEAQDQAKEHIRALRFGADNSGYFWIHDNRPFMIMHPYRRALEGQDLNAYQDPNGKFVFVEMVTLVEEQGAGFVDYLWQWKDDPSRVVQKVSYVKGFAPWGWIIGSGIYIEDAKAEITSFTRDLVWICGGIIVIVLILSTVVVLQGVGSRRRWLKAEDEARRHLVRVSHLSRLHTVKTMTTEIAHQIDQPLGSILLRTSLCTDTLREGDPVTRDLIENLAEIAVQVERTSQIVKHMRDFSNRREMEKARTDLNTIIASVLDFLAVEIMANQVTVNFEPGKNVPPNREPVWVFADATLIEQVVVNIIRNAIDALAEGPRAKRNLSIRTETADASVLVVFRDNGPGIAPDRIESIFEPTISDKNDGLGIGLSICRSIVEEHEGRLWAEAGIDQGSVFSFTLPLEN
jgi:signal transduction histidine kinase